MLYFNAIRTDALTPEIARNYNIVRSANRALVNISMVKKAEGTPGVPVPGNVTAQAVNLNGQFKDLTAAGNPRGRRRSTTSATWR